MLNLDIIKPYYLDDNSIQPINIQISEHINTVKIAIEKQINFWCNCTILSKDGRRLLQTNDKRYNYEITKAINTIKYYCKTKEEKDNYYEMLLKQHNTNLEFEAINGFEYNPYAIKGSKSAIKKNKNKKNFFRIW